MQRIVGAEGALRRKKLLGDMVAEHSVDRVLYIGPVGGIVVIILSGLVIAIVYAGTSCVAGLSILEAAEQIYVMFAEQSTLIVGLRTERVVLALPCRCGKESSVRYMMLCGQMLYLILLIQVEPLVLRIVLGCIIRSIRSKSGSGTHTPVTPPVVNAL